MDKVGIDAYERSPDDAAGGANIDHGVSIRETWEAMQVSGWLSSRDIQDLTVDCTTGACR